MSDTTQDVADIKTESKLITKDLLETAIRLKEGSDEINVEKFTVKEGGAFGDNYASVVFSVKVTTTLRNGEEKVFSLIFKTAHDNEMAREWTFDRSKIFLKEGKTYSILIPDMIRYQKDLDVELFGPSVPNYYYSVFENYIGIIILEDMRQHGYRMADKMCGLDYEHCKLVMREIAAFHALSFALKDRNRKNLEKYDFVFHDSLFGGTFPTFVKDAVKASVNTIKAITTDDEISGRAGKLLDLDHEEVMKGLLEPKEPFALICHGDMWCNNMLFKYEDGISNQQPTDVKLLDLQMVRYALPSTDLNYFFYTSTTRKMRKEHMRDLLYIYYSAFMDHIKKLHLDFPEFTFEVLEQMVKEGTLFGVLCACIILPLILSKPDKQPDFTGKTEAEVQVILQDYFKLFAEIEDNVPIIKDRLIGTVEDAIELGLL